MARSNQPESAIRVQPVASWGGQMRVPRISEIATLGAAVDGAGVFSVPACMTSTGGGHPPGTS